MLESKPLRCQQNVSTKVYGTEKKWIKSYRRGKMTYNGVQANEERIDMLISSCRITVRWLPTRIKQISTVRWVETRMVIRWETPATIVQPSPIRIRATRMGTRWGISAIRMQTMTVGSGNIQFNIIDMACIFDEELYHVSPIASTQVVSFQSEDFHRDDLPNLQIHFYSIHVACTLIQM